MKKALVSFAPLLMIGAVLQVGSPARGATGNVVIAAAGDIACATPPDTMGSGCRYGQTSDLIYNHGYTKVLVLGDEQYPTGALSDFQSYYDSTWGRFKSKTNPVPGNHEYNNNYPGGAPGYFSYFPSRVQGPTPDAGYYSYDLPAGCTPTGSNVCWHVIALNSEVCSASDGGPGCESGTKEYLWLQSDLASHPSSTYPCTLAYWHHPRFAWTDAGDGTSGGSSAIQPFWSLLVANHADVVLNGHVHDYQHYRPMGRSGGGNPDGITEFIVGTGGVGLESQPATAQPATLVASQFANFGILKMTLKASSWTYQWISATGGTFTDASTSDIACV